MKFVYIFPIITHDRKQDRYLNYLLKVNWVDNCRSDRLSIITL